MYKVKEWNEMLAIGELHEFRDKAEISVSGEDCVFNKEMKYLCGTIITEEFDDYGEITLANGWIISKWMVDEVKIEKINNRRIIKSRPLNFNFR